LNRKQELYVADFETTTDEKDCRVWGWGLTALKKDYLKINNSIQSFLNHISMLKNPVIYFHNLKFDSEFILYYLLSNNYEFVKNPKDLKHKSFNCLKTDTGVIYSLQYMQGANLITIYDSLKILPFSVQVMAKTFNLDIKKGDIDYNKFRHENHEITDHERDYIINDVEIVKKSLNFMFDNNLKGITLASMCLNEYKSIIGKRNFERWFPIIDDDKFCRESYKGGFTYVNPKFQNVVINEGTVFDVNSLYPAVMRYDKLPYGKPIPFDGEPNKNEHTFHDLFIVKISCSFELKEGYIPSIQMKNNGLFASTEYLTSSNNYDVELTLTSVDYELFFKHYNVYGLNYLGGYYFKSSTTLFGDYIDKWTKVKINATLEGNKGMRTLSKLMLNSLYGKFGLNPKSGLKEPYLSENNIVKWTPYDGEERATIYVPLASFVTSYARKLTIESAQQNYDRFIYADTDSIHLVGRHEPDNIEIDSVKLGKWKHEYYFKRGRFIRAKTYIEEKDDGHNHIACAGLPVKLHEKVNFDNFVSGFEVYGKLRPKKVSGGVVLEESTFKIKS